MQTQESVKNNNVKIWKSLNFYMVVMFDNNLYYTKRINNMKYQFFVELWVQNLMVYNNIQSSNVGMRYTGIYRDRKHHLTQIGGHTISLKDHMKPH